MVSYVITGASRGLGYEFSRQLASNSANKVFSLVRNKSATEAKLEKDGIKNITVLQADITDLPALEAAAKAVSQATGGTLDVLINNAALIVKGGNTKQFPDFEQNPQAVIEEFEQSFAANATGAYKVIFAFLPLIRKGETKKVIAISSGMADLDLTNKFSVGVAGPYAASKAASNVVISKFNASYAKEGVLFLSISPGVVDTAEEPPNEEELEAIKPMVKAFMEYAPHFRGPISPAQSVEMVMKVIDNASVANGDGGAFVSHFGNKQWL